jgi:hypothetical protein
VIVVVAHSQSLVPRDPAELLVWHLASNHCVEPVAVAVEQEDPPRSILLRDADSAKSGLELLQDSRLCDSESVRPYFAVKKTPLTPSSYKQQRGIPAAKLCVNCSPTALSAAFFAPLI